MLASLVYLKTQRKYKEKALTLASTDSLELPEAGTLSAIEMRFSVQNATGLATTYKRGIPDHITSIEVTDGGTKKMCSLTMQEMLGLDWHHLGHMPPMFNIQYDSNYQRRSVVIPFGEYIGDPLHGLDLSSWDQVNLEITNDYTTSWVVTATPKVEVRLHTIEDLAAKPQSYYKHYEWKSESPSAAGQYVYHKIPTTDKIRRLMCQIDPTVSSATAAPENSYTDSNNIKLYFNERTQTVFDLRPKDLFEMNSAVYGRPVVFHRFPQSTTVYSDTEIAHVSNMPFGDLNQSGSASTPTAQPRSQENNLRFMLLDVVTAGAASNNVVDCVTTGDGFFGCGVLFDAMGPEEAKFLDPSKSGSGKGPVEVEWYGSAAVHKFRSFLTVPQKQGQA